MSEKPTTCFVIMPFSKTTPEHPEEYWTQHFEDFLKPTIEEVKNLKAERSEALKGDILDSIIRHLVYDPVVVADLTDFNPNVFWELGVRQSFMHGTITIMEGPPARIPFDLGRKGTLFYYAKNVVKNQEFKAKLQSALQECLAKTPSPDSAVLQAVTGRGTLFQAVNRDQSLRRIQAALFAHFTNAKILGDIFVTIDKNQKDPSNREFPTVLLHSAQAELLSSDRYLDEDDAFYALVQRYERILHQVSAQLMVWEDHIEITEGWFLKMKDRWDAIFKEYEAALNASKDKLLKTI